MSSYVSMGTYANVDAPTPLVDITSYFPGTQGKIVAKVEGKWPNRFSVKDRIARQMLDDAEAEGRIHPGEFSFFEDTGKRELVKPGSIITEGTSGNTGLGLVSAGIPRGYRIVLAIPEKMDPIKVQLMRAYGAKVFVVPTDEGHGSPYSYTGVAERLAFELEGLYTRQHDNPSNAKAHYATTGPEIFAQTAGTVTHLIAGSGTGGTISGTGRYLKEKKSTVRVIGVDPVGSPLKFIFDYYRTHGVLPPHEEVMKRDGAYLVEGIGMGHKTGNTDFEVIDEFVKVVDGLAFSLAKDFFRVSAIDIGGSSGAALAAARQIAPTLKTDDVAVVVFPDSGRAYVNRFLDERWVADKGLESHGAERTLEQLIAAKPIQFVGTIVFAIPDQTVGELIRIMEGLKISQMPFAHDGQDMGRASVNYQVLQAGIAEGEYGLDSPIGEIVRGDDSGAFKPFPTLPITASRKALEEKLFRNSAVLITRGDRVVNLLTIADQLELV